MSTSTSTDTRFYANVLYSDHSLQLYMTVGANLLATPINFLTFYLILFKSKRERPSFKVGLFISQLSYYIAQFHLGVLTGLVTLHPFPGFYAVGLLKEYVSSFILCFVWTILFCSYVYCTFVLLVIRLRIVARPGGFFGRSNVTFNLCYFLLAVYVFTPVPGMLLMSYSSRDEMEQFVRTMFPNNMMIFEHPGVYIFTNQEDSSWIQAVMIFVVLSALIVNFRTIPRLQFPFQFIVFMYMAITKEIRQSLASKSSQHAQDSQKSLTNLVVQSVSYSIFLSISCGILLKAFFNDPSVDNRIPNVIAYTSLCGASIPCQIMMISRNTAYRDFVLRRAPVSSLTPGHSQHRNSVFLKA